MKLKKPDNHSMADKLFKHIPDKIREYTSQMFRSSKCKKMTHGSCDIVRMMTCAHGDNWRRNHPKCLNKQHKK